MPRVIRPRPALITAVLVERTATGVEPGVVRPGLAMRLFRGNPHRADSVEIGGVGVGVESPAVSVELVRAAKCIVPLSTVL